MLSITVLACYLASAAWLASSVFRAEDSTARGRRIAGLGLGTLALLMHGAWLWSGVFGTPTLSLTATETASLIGWPMAAIALVTVALRPRFAGLASVVIVASGLVAAIAQPVSGREVEQQSWEIGAHIVLSTLAYALLTIAVVQAVALALLDRRLRNRRPLGWLKILPSVEALEAGTFRALAVGLAVLTFALFTGFIFVDDLFAQHLIHKTVLSCLAWAVFAVLVFGRWRFGWRGRTAMHWTLSGFALLGLAYFGSKIVLESILGRHWG